MIRIGLNIGNRVISESIMIILRQTGDFKPVYLECENPDKIITECIALKPDILLFDARPSPSCKTVEERISVMQEIRNRISDCKIALICDETAFPEVASEVMRAKQAGRIDAFFFGSVTAEYLIASLYAL